MKIRWLFSVLAVFAGLSTLFAEVPEDLYLKNPLAFEPNRGQADPLVRFVSRGNGYGLYLTDTEAVITFVRPEPVAIRMTLIGQNPHPAIAGFDRQPGVSHYLYGGGPEDWQTAIPHFSRVRYSEVYPGIDLIYYGNQRQLEYDFAVAPRADSSSIQMEFAGVDHISINEEGDLVLKTRAGEIRHKRPVAYQEIAGVRRPVEAAFVLRGARRAGFKLGTYDASIPLIIDPTLVWSSFLGGVGSDSGNDVAVDAAGNVYVTGYTLSPDFWSINAPQPSHAGRLDAFVTKIDPNAAIVYSTYLGGTGDDESHSIGLDAAGNIFIAGFTTSADWPVVNAFQSTFGGSLDAYVLKLNNSGNAILYSTYLGGNQLDRAFGISVDAAGNAFVAGTTASSNFPISNAFQSSLAGGLGDAFLTKIAPDGSVLYSTFLGGIGNDVAYDVAVDGDGNVVLTGFTSSINFPTASALYSNFRGGSDDVFITKFNGSGNALVFSTYLGGSSSDNGVRLAIDRNNNIVATGYTSSPDFPLKNPAQLFHKGVFDAFLIKLHPDGQDADFSTYIGGEDTESGVSVAIGPDDGIYLVGYTNSIQFYAINSIGGFLRGLRDGFVMKIVADASVVVFSSYLGGFGIDGATAVAVDGAGNAYVTGFTLSSDFPLAANAFQGGIGGDQDGFIVKIDATDIKTQSPFSVPPQGSTSIATAGQTSVPIFGYAAGDVTAGITPTGIEIVDLRSTGVLVNEVGLPAAMPLVTGRLLAKTGLSDNTALSMANVSAADIRIDFYFTAEDGTTGNFGFFTLPANTHVSALLRDQPFNVPMDTFGTLTFTADAPLFVTALRVDESGPNPVNTHVPIVDPYTANNRPVTVPVFADGQGWTTQVFLVNTTESQMDGEIRLFRNGAPGEAGIPAEIATELGVNSVFPYSIPPRAIKTLIGRGESSELITGQINIVPAAGSSTPSSFALLTFSENSGFMKATVEALEPGLEFKAYVESSGTFFEPLAATPAVAIANDSDVPAVVQLTLTDLNGLPSGLSASVTIPPKSILSRFLYEIPGFETLPSPYQGVVRVTTNAPGITATGFRARYNERNQFLMLATGPLKDLSGLPSVVFPHLVDGGGYATQFILINGASGAGSSGVLRYLDQSGAPLNLAISN